MPINPDYFINQNDGRLPPIPNNIHLMRGQNRHWVGRNDTGWRNGVWGRDGQYREYYRSGGASAGRLYEPGLNDPPLGPSNQIPDNWDYFRW